LILANFIEGKHCLEFSAITFAQRCKAEFSCIALKDNTPRQAFSVASCYINIESDIFLADFFERFGTRNRNWIWLNSTLDKAGTLFTTYP
jgi:hypothetical protein